MAVCCLSLPPPKAAASVMVSSPAAQQPCEGAMANGPVHPLAGRTGEGPPIAPVGWKWAAGRRRTDTYFFSPQGTRFRSKSQLESYLASIPDAPSLSEFCWRFSPTEFEGPLPGTIGTPMGGRIMKKSKMRKIPQGNRTMLKTKEDNNETSLNLTEPVHGFTLFEQESLISTLQKKYNEEIIEWKKSKEKADQQKDIVRKAREQLKIAKAEAVLKSEQVHFIHKSIKKAHRKLDMLLKNYKPKPFPEDEIETQKRVFDAEVSDLKSLFRKIANLNIADADFIIHLSSLLESQNSQKERVNFAEAKLRLMNFATTS